MSDDKSIELAVEVPVETKRAVERAAAAKGISVSEFIENALQKMLAEIGRDTNNHGTN